MLMQKTFQTYSLKYNIKKETCFDLGKLNLFKSVRGGGGATPLATRLSGMANLFKSFCGVGT